MSAEDYTGNQAVLTDQSPDSEQRFQTAQASFNGLLVGQKFARRRSNRLLAARTELVHSTERLLEDAHYIEVTGDFHLQEPYGSGKPGEDGLRAEGMRLEADKLWVGPYNRQTKGYAELDGGIMTLKNHGDVPVLAWRGEPYLRPGYPLIASMASVALKNIDSNAEKYPVTRRFGLTRGSAWSEGWQRIYSSNPQEVRNLVSESIPLLVEEGKIHTIGPEERMHGIFTHYMHVKDNDRCWIAVDSNEVVQRIEFGWSPDTIISERYLFEGSNEVVLSYTPHTSHLNRAGIYSSTYRRAHFLNESDEAINVSYAAAALVKVFELASMTTGDHRSHTTGFGMYADPS